MRLIYFGVGVLLFLAIGSGLTNSGWGLFYAVVAISAGLWLAVAGITDPATRARKVPVLLVGGIAWPVIVGAILGFGSPVLGLLLMVGVPALVLAVVALLSATGVLGEGLGWRLTRKRSTLRKLAKGEDSPVELIRETMLASGGGAYVGTWSHQGEPVASNARGAMGVLGGPGSGKSRGILIPAVMGHPGPVVSASTKPEVLQATQHVRRLMGRTYIYDPAGVGSYPPDVVEVRWSPLLRAVDYDGAQLVAAAMIQSASFGQSDSSGGSHFAERAATLLGVYLHAAALGGLTISDVLSWVLETDIEGATDYLPAGSIALSVLTGIENTPEKERGSIFSTAAGVLRAYTSSAAVLSASPPDEDAVGVEWLDVYDLAASEADTLYIVAPSERQQQIAPLVVGMLTDLRSATYTISAEIVRAGEGERRWPPLLWALDECANIAPLPDLPAILSEAGGQGLQVCAVFQEMGQMRRRWPAEAQGMLSLFSTLCILPGIRDKETLELGSMLIGDYDREVETTSTNEGESRGYGGFGDVFSMRQSTTKSTGSSTSLTTRRERIVPPERIAQMKAGEALIFLGGSDWEIVQLPGWDQHPAWKTLHTFATEQAEDDAAAARSYSDELHDVEDLDGYDDVADVAPADERRRP